MRDVNRKTWVRNYEKYVQLRCLHNWIGSSNPISGFEMKFYQNLEEEHSSCTGTKRAHPRLLRTPSGWEKKLCAPPPPRPHLVMPAFQ